MKLTRGPLIGLFAIWLCSLAWIGVLTYRIFRPSHRLGLIGRTDNLIAGTAIGITATDNTTTGQQDVTINNTSPGTPAPSCALNQLIESDGGAGFQCGPSNDTNFLILSNPSGVPTFVGVSGAVNLTGYAAGNAIFAQNPDPLTVLHGGTGDSTATAHAVAVGEGSSPLAFVGGSCSASTFLGCNSGADPSFQTLGTPPTIISGINHGSSNTPTTTYATFATVTLTVAGGVTATIDCTADIQWSFTIAGGTGSQLNWGISQDSTAAPTNARSVVQNSTPGDVVSGAMVESYAGTSAGAHTYRVLIDEQAALGVGQSSGVRADLLCLQH